MPTANKKNKVPIASAPDDTTANTTSLARDLSSLQTVI